MIHGNRYDNVSRGNRGRRDPGNLFNSAADLLYLLHDRELEDFSKAGEPGWKSLIPFYNVYTEYKLQSIWTRFRLWRRTFLPPADLLNDPRIRKRPVPGKSVIKTEYKRWEAGALGGSCFFDAEEIAMKFLSRRTCPKNVRTDRYNKIILQMESENKEWGRSREMRTKIQDTWDI